MTMDTYVGERVHQLMWRARLSQRQAAPKIGLTQSGLSRKIRGDRPWHLDELAAIAGLLGVNVADLLPPNAVSPQPAAAEGSEVLPRLDSNQQPAG